ncbi:hypothetical protein [Malacoplasma iowae]|uniref:Uncharacterized protein n=1 Tax=Malacoplasma iowae 695 TaxID=1048830 RepID=A0A6P1LFU1_MALIO|nr:hypothetical protein [Malacoplasma iowae]VEU63010.1 Uncharacterised protein [Mycoplasmopsis fermentans]EGZ31035.1 hypothetical protein GUU_04039 [Malacoplasma iowae 695]QHG89490.1 hypothetical protein EER00_01075 [Malacoplasma iowae 695]WPL35736.1 hypothetical protein QX180_05440 [Malacoplasma iowae]WPL35764.1 hypothetical protein QX180_05585 [Malacoplasma iowae]
MEILSIFVIIALIGIIIAAFVDQNIKKSKKESVASKNQMKKEESKLEIKKTKIETEIKKEKEKMKILDIKNEIEALNKEIKELENKLKEK